MLVHRIGCSASVVLVLGAACALIPGSVQAELPAHKPNIIYIMADDLGYGDLECYGQQRIRTPNIDRMAAEGMRFTDHYAGSTVCAPSRCVLMTGVHTGHAYIRGNREVRPMGQMPLPEKQVTVAELLKQAGYTTALIGKWGLGGPGTEGEPNCQGFDYFFGYLCQRHAHNYYPEFLFRNAERVPLEGNVVPGSPEDGAGVAVRRAQYSHDLLTREALKFLENNRKGPFFLYLALTIPHANNQAEQEGMEVPDLGQYADKGWPDPQKGHASMISRMDDDVGRLLAELRELGIERNTLVLFTSDNGPHREGGNNPDFNDSSGPLRGIKRDLYEGGIRVPLIARWPGRIAPGQASDHVSAFWDFLPTACQLARIEPPQVIDGISYLPMLLGQGKQDQHDYLYWEFHEGEYSKQAVRMSNWKAVWLRPGGSAELYDLSTDLGETNDVAGAHPEVVERMESARRQAHVDSQAFPMRRKK